MVVLEDAQNVGSEIIVDFLINIIMPRQKEMLDLVGEDFGNEHRDAEFQYITPLLARSQQYIAHIYQ